MLRAELTRAEYDALVDDLEQLGFEVRGRGPMAAFEGVAIYVDGRPAAHLSNIAIPVPGNGAGGRRQ